jgi:protein-disulfide isomerase
MKLRTSLDLLASVALIAAAGVVVWVNVGPGSSSRSSKANAEIPIPKDPVDFAAAPMEGSTSAPVAIVEFSDFQCPYCRSFSQKTLPILRSKFIEQGQVVLAFRHFPLSIHPLAIPNAGRAECAHQQNRFWEAHDFLFADPRNLEAPTSSWDSLGLNSKGFADCAQGAPSPVIELDATAAKQLKLRSTPSFLVGSNLSGNRVRVSEVITGAKGIEVFEAAIIKVVSAQSRR